MPNFSRSGTVSSASIAAKVNDRDILKSEVYKLSEKLNIEYSVALEILINDELAFQDAAKKLDSRIISDLYKSSAVYYLIESDFEKNFSPDKIPDDKLRMVYNEIQQNLPSRYFRKLKYYFGHSEWRKVIQLIVTKESLKDEMMQESVLSFMRILLNSSVSSSVKDDKEFGQLAWYLQNSYYPVRFENTIPPLSLKKIENRVRFGRDFDSGFIKKIFSSGQEGKIFEPFVTKYGVHFVYLEKIIKEYNKQFDEVKDELRNKLSENWLRKNFKDWLFKIKSKYTYSINY
ncbi:MAG: hypothetical protein JXR95_15525 [Deltaproteobacteria bacterium]|nr:hypothetical protein [Deltaproteobacteria bacterium]